LKKSFREPPDFAAKGVIYSLAELKERAEILLAVMSNENLS